MADRDGYTTEHPNILNYIASDYDRDLMLDAMKKAVMAIPRVVNLSFHYFDNKIEHLCHIYRMRQGYFIGGWRREDNLVDLFRYKKRRASRCVDL